MAKQLSITRLDDVINSEHSDGLTIDLSFPIITEPWLNAFIDKIAEKNPRIGERQSLAGLRVVRPWANNSAGQKSIDGQVRISFAPSPRAAEYLEIARLYQNPSERTVTYIYCGMYSETHEVYRPGHRNPGVCRANDTNGGYFPETQNSFRFKASLTGPNAKNIAKKLVSDARDLTCGFKSAFYLPKRVRLSPVFDHCF